MMTLIKWLIIIVILGGGAWYWYSNGTFALPWAMQVQTATTTPQQPAATTTPQAAAQNPSGLPTAIDDTSDSALTKDMLKLDAELSSASQDSAAVDESLNDKPVEQSY